MSMPHTRRAWHRLLLNFAEKLVLTTIDPARPGAMEDARRNITLLGIAEAISDARKAYFMPKGSEDGSGDPKTDRAA